MASCCLYLVIQRVYDKLLSKIACMCRSMRESVFVYMSVCADICIRLCVCV